MDKPKASECGRCEHLEKILKDFIAWYDQKPISNAFCDWDYIEKRRDELNRVAASAIDTMLE